jgi:hypothetical protein
MSTNPLRCPCRICEPGRPPWAFADGCPHNGAITSRRVLAGQADVCAVLHWPGGTWEFLDSQPMGLDDIAVVPLGLLVEVVPMVAGFGSLPRGRQAWLDCDRWMTGRLRARPEPPSMPRPG